MRQAYHRFVPHSFRTWLWTTYWLIISLTRDYKPKKHLFEPDNYDKYWDGRLEKPNGDNLSYRELIDFCSKELTDNQRILDFGCGSGHLLAALAQRHSIEALGLDISARAVEIAKQYGVKAQQFTLTTPNDLLQYGHFDVAIATEVIEHIVASELVLVALGLVADKVMISIPNTGFINYRLRLLAGRFPRQWHEHPAEHVRFWTKADFEFVARLSGFEVQSVAGVAGGRLGRLYPSLFAPGLFFVLKTIPKPLAISHHTLPPQVQ